ncbi:MAG: chromatin protein Cren7 [Treponema sp.]|nr:chromatin protein Cren7 [Treponema sp.]
MKGVGGQRQVKQNGEFKFKCVEVIYAAQNYHKREKGGNRYELVPVKIWKLESSGQKGRHNF